MIAPPGFPPDDESCARLDQVILEFEQAVDRGENPDPALWFANYPELEAKLRLYFENRNKARNFLAKLPKREGNSRRIAENRDTPGESSTTRALPSSIGAYEIRRQLGRGGMGVVYLAHHKKHGDVALKVLKRDEDQDPIGRSRFRDEYRVLKELEHPHIVKLLDHGEDGNRYFFAMEFVAGGTLKKHIEDRRLKQPGWVPKSMWAAQLMEKIARAVHHAHTKKIVHRDLKPGNILLDDNEEPKEPRVADFGLAKDLDDPEQTYRTQSNQVLGTPAYMSPEQARGESKHVTEQSDIRSLGAVFYFLLTGCPPYRGHDWDVIHRIAQSKPPSPRSDFVDVDEKLETICLKAMAFHPKDRYETAAEFADALGNFLARPTAGAQFGPVTRGARTAWGALLDFLSYPWQLWYEPTKFWSRMKHRFCKGEEGQPLQDLTIRQRLEGNRDQLKYLLPVSLAVSIGFARIFSNPVPYRAWLWAWLLGALVIVVAMYTTYRISQWFKRVEFGLTAGMLTGCAMATGWGGLAGAGFTWSCEFAALASGIVGAIAAGGIEIEADILKARKIGVLVATLLGPILGAYVYLIGLSPLYDYAGLPTPNPFIIAALFTTSYLCFYFRIFYFPCYRSRMRRVYEQAVAAPAEVSSLWPRCPVYWNEVIWFSLPHLSDFLELMLRQDRRAGEKAVELVTKQRVLQMQAAHEARSRHEQWLAASRIGLSP